MSPTTIRIPTYPFQRRRFYLSTTPYRSQPTQDSSSLIIKPMIVDQSLVELLTDHRIEGRRVLPGAALVDFFARMRPDMVVKKIQFHQPPALELPESNDVYGELDVAHQLIMKQGGEKGSKNCSGLLRERPAVTTRKKEALNIVASELPLRTVTHEQIYHSFNNVSFGQQFRDVRVIDIWEGRADAVISIEPSQKPGLDRI